MELNEKVLKEISLELNVKENAIKQVLDLLSEDKTVAFIARYRKEATGGLDEEEIRKINDRYQYEVNLSKRKEDVCRLIDEKGLLTDELKDQIMNATKLITVEDLYRPFKEKKKTKATEAINNGLSPLADIMLELRTSGNKEEIVSEFLNEKVLTYNDAIKGAEYIIAERVSDDANVREYIRSKALTNGTIFSKKKKNDNDPEEKYALYYDSSEAVAKIKPHRVLAINRAEKEEVINVSMDLDDINNVNYLISKYTKDKDSLFRNEIVDAVKDSYDRLIEPSVEREIRGILTDNAEEQAIKVFSLNLKALLLEAPIKGKTVLGVDPAFRTGCKLAVISPSSNVLEIGVIYPTERAKGVEVDEADLLKSEKTVLDLCNKYNVDIIAIGNGTASRETEAFIADVINKNNLPCKYVIVSEAGASVYSASELAIEEFPDLTVEKRSAISIARRIQDPLAELVKIDPKSIGVGQYQHDVTPKKLSESLDNVVVDAVNRVGVNLNTASVSLLQYVSGLSKATAKNIVKYREDNKRFYTREELLKVSKMGPKTYEQCVGFLRIIDGKNPLDQTGIHPESYDKATMILSSIGADLSMLGTEEIKTKVNEIDREKMEKELNIDSYTFNDILDSFVAPQRDIRESYPGPKLRSDIMHFEDIKVGDELDGVVRNVVDFGCFVDCYVKYDGLVHVSNMSKKRIEHPTDLLSVGDNVHVYVIGIDYDKHKMELSMINPNEKQQQPEKIEINENLHDISDLEVGMKVFGIVKNITNYGAFIDLGLKKQGLLHMKDMDIYQVTDPNLYVKLQDKVEVYVLAIDKENEKIDLSLVDPKKRLSIKDFKVSDKVLGKVHNIASYGAFIDLGIGKDGFLHNSCLNKERKGTCEEILKVSDMIECYIMAVDTKKEKIDLSLIDPSLYKTIKDFKPNTEVDGVISNVTNYGAFVDLGIDEQGLIYIENLSKDRVLDPKSIVKIGDKVHCYILNVDYDKKKIDLSLVNPKDVLKITDLKVGDEVLGKVRQIEAYGAFLDLGYGIDGLLHKSNMAKFGVSDPNEVVKLGDEIKCYIKEIDAKKNKIQLSLVDPKTVINFNDIKSGMEFDGIVRRIQSFGAFVDLGVKHDGLIHISRMSREKVYDPNDILKVGDMVHVYVIGVDYDTYKLELSLLPLNTDSLVD